MLIAELPTMINVTVEPSIACNAAPSSNDNPSSTLCPSIMPDSSTEHAKTSNMKSNENIFMDLRQSESLHVFYCVIISWYCKGS